jgi:Zn-dependent metalloprotease
MDPVSDIMAATKGIPIAAFPGQNHDAHIQTKMAYLQDPMNGANPIMQRIRPILEANIQEHSVMKYQEQMNGMAQQTIGQLPPEQQQNPAVVEMVMAQAAQQVMNANQAAGMAQSPEQQLVALEQAKVELQKQKLQSDTAVQAAEMEIKNKQLELDENEQIIDILKAGATDNFKKEKAEKDRQSKEKIKEMDVLSKVSIEELKVTSQEDREGLDALVKMAVEQTKKETKNGNEEG